LKAIDEQTFLVPPKDPAASTTVKGRLEGVFGTGKKVLGIDTVPPGTKVTKHFTDLHRLVTGDAGSTPIDGVVRRLDELQKKVAALGERVGNRPATDAGAVGAASEVAGQLKLDAEQLMPVVGAVVSKIAAGASAAVRGGLSGTLANRYQANVVQQCRDLVTKYPFNPSSTDDVPLQDFGRVFGPDGVFDSFFKTELSELVDTAQQPWAWRRDDSGASVGGALPLTRFEDARRIRDTFFRSGSTEPAVGFTVTPLELDRDVRAVSLDVHGKSIEYQHGPQRTIPMAWPGEKPGGPAAVTFNDLSGASQSLMQPGAWAWWRLLDQGRMERDAGSDVRYRLTLEKGGRKVLFMLEASSIRNPFGTSLLRDFRCA
jgi:type VI secretion system protein ImpL